VVVTWLVSSPVGPSLVGPSSLVEEGVLSFSLEVVVVSFSAVEELFFCPLEEGAVGVVGVSSPYLTPHANN